MKKKKTLRKPRKSIDRAPAKPTKEKEFKLYVLWKSLPPLLRNELEQKPALWQKTGFGDNPVIEELLKIKTQGEFAKKFSLSTDTLAVWNHTIESRDLLGDYRKWAKHLTHNLLMAMYHKGIKYGDAHRVELWLKAVHNWSEKNPAAEQLGQTLADLMKNTLKKYKTPAEQNGKETH